MNIGFIGTGNMGGAIIRALGKAGGVVVYGLNRTRSALDALAAETGLVPCSDVRELAEKSEYVVLAVKPQQADAVWPELVPALTRDNCLVSIAAGLTVQTLRERTENVCPVVRAMPNMPALIGEGVTAVCFDDPAVTPEQREGVREIFKPSGEVHVLPERGFDAFTAVVGSGPAMVFHLIETFIESGVELGLDRDTASRMVKKLFSGAARMAETSDEHVSLLREASIAPAGTTIAALAHFERTAIRGNVMDAIRRAHDRSVALGRE